MEYLHLREALVQELAQLEGTDDSGAMKRNRSEYDDPRRSQR